jgi:hypothetical protein
MPRAATLRERFDHFFEWLEAASVEIPGVRPFLFLWHKLGLAGTVLVLALVGAPLGEYSLISLAVNRTVPKLAGDFGMDFDAEWSYHPFSLKAVARHVKIKPEHPASAAPIFTAAEIEFQGSLASTISTVWDAVRLRPLHTFNEITIRKGELHLERSLNGTMNVAEHWERMDETRRQELKAGLYHINAISLDDVKVEYVERVPGRSGGGVIETAQVNIHVDAISGAITDIGPVDLSAVSPNRPPRMPTRISLTARSSDGTLDIQGAVALIETGGEHVAADARIQRVALGGRDPIAASPDAPLYELYVQLNNIGAAAFTRTVPGLELVATRGVVHGKIVFRDHAPSCESQAAMVDVEFGPNPNVVLVPARYSEIQQQRQHWSYSGKYDPCEGLDAPDQPAPADANPAKKPAGPLNASRTGAAAAVLAFNRQATTTAPPALRSAILRDERKYTGESAADAAIGDVSSQVTQHLGQAASKLVGPRTGAVLQRSLAGEPAASQAGANQHATGNPVAKGAKSVGNGIKRLFGGGDRKDKPKS